MRDIVLRGYQLASIDGLRQGIRDGHRAQILCAPTGSGKTVMAAHLMREARSKGSRVGFVVDRVALVNQTSRTLDTYGIDHGVQQAGHWRRRGYEYIQICSAQTIEKRGFFPDLKLLIVDECFPGETEILTEGGFVRFDQLDEAARVAQYSIGSGEITFVPPSARIKRAHSGEMIRLKSQTLLDIRMTPNHQLVVRDINRIGRAYEKIEAGMATINSFKRLPVAGRARGDESPLTPFERLLIAVQADGSRHTDHSDGSATFAFTFSKPRKVERFLEIVRSAGVEWSEVGAQPNSSANARARRRFMVRRLPGNAKSVHLHFSIGGMGFSRATAIINEMVHWDGYEKRADYVYFSSTDANAANFYQAVALLAGYKTNQTVQHDGRSELHKDVYRVFINKSCDEISGQAIRKSVEPYNGEVYCVRVPEGCIVVRSNGKPLIVGNCHAMRKATIDLIRSRNDINVIGLTATPFTKGMGEVYSNVVNVTTTNRLIEEGFLVPLKMYAAKAVDMTGAKVVAGEWSEKEIEVRGSAIVGDIVNEWIDKTLLHFGGPAKTLVFSATVDHGEELCRQFNAAGFNFQQISYKDGNDERREALIEEFRRPNSSIHGLVSCEALAKGFDVTDVMVGVSARPYRKSLSGHIQQLGRVMRPHEGKTFGLWLDHSGNVLRFKDDTDDIFENGAGGLDDGQRDSKARSEPTEKVRETIRCGGCGFVLPVSAKVCPACGKERASRSLVETIPGVMIEIGGKRVAATGKYEFLNDRERVWREVCAIALERKHGDYEAAQKFAQAQYRNIYGDFARRRIEGTELLAPSTQVSNLIRHNIIRWAKSRARQAA